MKIKFRNWPTFDFIHTKKCNRLACATVKDIAKVHDSLTKSKKRERERERERDRERERERERLFIDEKH